jgi:hypothetical protein
MISLVAFVVLVVAIIGVLELTHRRRSAEPRPEADLRDDRDFQRTRAEARFRRPSPRPEARPEVRPVTRLHPVRSVPAKASSAA